jgi:hypothetical protein
MSDTTRRICVSAFAASALAVWLASDAHAQKGRGRARAAVPHGGTPRAAVPHGGMPRAAVPHARGYSNPRRNNNNGNQNNGAVIATLQSAMGHLSQADHDYQGHRVKALNHVGTAIRHLEPAAVRRNQPNPAAALNTGQGAGGKNLMPQATSDTHLRKALQTLNNVQGHLSGGTTTNHARARTSVQNAIRELNVALNVR